MEPASSYTIADTAADVVAYLRPLLDAIDEFMNSRPVTAVGTGIGVLMACGVIIWITVLAVHVRSHPALVKRRRARQHQRELQAAVAAEETPTEPIPVLTGRHSKP